MTKRYKIGFARPALLRETVLIAQLFRDFKQWSLVEQTVKEDQILQTRTNRTSGIVYSEIKKRLSLLSEEQIEVIAEDTNRDVCQLVWIAICKQYPFIGDFTLEVLRLAIDLRRGEITFEDYSHFFNDKADWHDELEKVSDKTRSNAKLAIFQMMRQCELISDNNQIIPQMLSSAIQNCSSDSDLAFIPGALRL